jgi:hypothetical protein
MPINHIGAFTTGFFDFSLLLGDPDRIVPHKKPFQKPITLPLFSYSFSKLSPKEKTQIANI